MEWVKLAAQQVWVAAGAATAAVASVLGVPVTLPLPVLALASLQAPLPLVQV